MWLRPLHPKARDWLKRGTKTRRYEPPSEPTIRRMLKQVPAADFDAEVTAWMQAHDPQPLRRLAVDGTTVKGSRRADGRPMHLVAGISPDSLRLVAQRPVDEKSNEITTLRPTLSRRLPRSPSASSRPLRLS